VLRLCSEGYGADHPISIKDKKRDRVKLFAPLAAAKTIE
jgi:hypothetical protein